MAMKKKGFGIGKWNGVGGKVKQGETIETAALREMQEEIGISAGLAQLESVGNLKFYFQGKPDWDEWMHIFLVKDWQGEPMESDEMLPRWFKRQEIPFGDMWCCDKHWVPSVLQGKKIEGEVYFNPDGSAFDKFEIREIFNEP